MHQLHFIKYNRTPCTDLKKRQIKLLTVCYHHVTYEFQSESTLYSLPECGFTLKLVRDMIITYSQMHRTDKHSQRSSIIWPVCRMEIFLTYVFYLNV